MNTRDLVILTGVMFLNFLAGIGVVPFLAIFALSYPGVASGQAGIFLAIISGALTVGSIAGGWLANRFGRRKKLMQISSVIGLPAFFLIAYTSQLWQLTLMACIAWFALGMATTLVRIIAGILADEAQRGRIFGIINSAIPAAALVSGLIGGRIVDQWDIPTLFMLLSLTFAGQFVLLFFIDEIQKPVFDDPLDTQSVQGFSVGLPYWMLVIATVASFVALSQMVMGRPLLMEQLGFTNTAISGVLVAGGLISLPMTFLVGELSDRIGRKTMVLISLGLVIPGMAILSIAEPLWHFWVSEMMLAFTGVANVVGFAFVADLVPRRSLDTAMSYYSASGWIGTIIGYLFVGYIIDWVGLSNMFITATIMSTIALLIVFQISVPTMLPLKPVPIPQAVD